MGNAIQEASGRSDLWTLGVSLCGQLPFHKSSVSYIITAASVPENVLGESKGWRGFRPPNTPQEGVLGLTRLVTWGFANRQWVYHQGYQQPHLTSMEKCCPVLCSEPSTSHPISTAPQGGALGAEDYKTGTV